MRAYVFYPLLAIAAAATIAASFGFALAKIEPSAQAASLTKQGYRFGPEQLAHIDPGQDQILHATRSWKGVVESVQIGTQRVSGEPNRAVQGARLVIAPETARVLGDAPLKVTVRYRPLFQNAAAQLSLSAQGAGPTEWVTQPLPVAEGKLEYLLPAPTDGALTAIGLWPHPQADEYYSSYGVELMDVRIERSQ